MEGGARREGLQAGDANDANALYPEEARSTFNNTNLPSCGTQSSQGSTV